MGCVSRKLNENNNINSDNINIQSTVYSANCVHIVEVIILFKRY